MIDFSRVRPLFVTLASVTLSLIVLQFSYKYFVSLLQEQALNRADSIVHMFWQYCRGMGLANECKEFIQTVNQENIMLVLELTEREVLDFYESTEVLFSDLKKLECKIAIDDFGTGHSSLANLQKFQVNYIKIDQMFVQGVESNPTSRHLVESTIELANRLSRGCC
ncbi:EAL domain-containing protein [Pseudoalteromonas sp. D15MCD-2]|uniref:EAL domain-containing protein n=1 Tax=Pseudoalteromonas sp. D15MCD-2 TaxID=3138933 RepID=UPI0031588537